MLILHLAMLSIILGASFILIYLLVLERDLLKMAVLSAGQSALYALALYILMVPDVALAYITVAVGIYTALMVLAVKRTERYEEP